MNDERKQDKLAECVDSVIATGEFASSGDEDVDALARLAVGLRGLPTPEFKVRLGAELLPKRDRGAWWPLPGRIIARLKSLAIRPWLRRNRPFAVAGGSCGLLAGTCCVSGAVASVFGLASAAAVAAFIDSTLPYFVAASVAVLAAWLAARLVRQQRLTPSTFAMAVRRHGLAMGTAYSAVFGASMGLAMALGLY